MATATRELDEAKLEEFMGQAVTDVGAAMNAVLVMIGGQLGLWKAMHGAGPLTTAEIADRTGVRERYVREWASAQAASDYLEYDADADTFELPPEQAMAFADEDSPVYLLGGFHVISSAFKDREKIAERFRSGDGFGWHEHDPELFMGTRAVLPAGLPDSPGRRVDPGARRRRGEAPERREGRRHRLRSRDLDDPDGAGVSRVDVPRLRLSRRVDHTGNRDRRHRGGRGRPRSSPLRARRTFRARAMTWSASSTACTTWAIQSAR